MSTFHRTVGRTWLPVFAAIVSMAFALVLVMSRVTSEAQPLEELSLGLAAIAVCCAVAIRYLILPAHLPAALDNRVVLLPVLILGLATSFFSNGVGPLLAHQAAWAAIAVVAVIIAIAKGHASGAVPTWLIVFIGLGLALQLAAGDGSQSILDSGIVGLALLISWNVAGGQSADGSVVRFLGYVAALYWLVTLAGVLVAITGFSIGSMSPITVTPPWGTGVNQNYLGYGFVSTQVGRMLTAIVSVYHLVRWRHAPKRNLLHAALCLLAAVLFLFEYGRVPLIGGILAIAIVLTTMSPGTRFAARLGILLVVASIATAGLLSEGADSGAFSLRIGTANWDSGHLALWNQQLQLFTIAPLAGVSSHPTDDQIYKASLNSIIPIQYTLNPATSALAYQASLVARGSRGEGGWTGLLAQRGIVGSSIVLALLVVAIGGLFRRDSNVSGARLQDAILLRAILPATLVWYLTDIQVAGFTSFTDYVVLQLTMFGVAIELRRRRSMKLRGPAEKGQTARELSSERDAISRRPVGLSGRAMHDGFMESIHSLDDVPRGSP